MNAKQVIELTLDTMAHGGEALGHHNGRAVFVQGAIPGERVRAEIVEHRRRWVRAQLLSVLDASPSRVEPPCPYFGRCGGCQWQHIDYGRQLEYKQQVVVDQLQRLGHLQDAVVRPVIGMAEPWRYRNHAQFVQNERGQLGFQAPRSHNIIPIEHCMLLHPLLDQVYRTLDLDWPELRRLSLRAGIHTTERMIILETADDRVPELAVDARLSCVHRSSDGTDVALIGHTAYHEKLQGRRYRVSASSFFQVNSCQAQELLDVVRRYVEPSPRDVLLDAYCGVGTLGLSMQADLGHLVGIEEHPAAVADARINAQGIGHTTFVQGKAETIVPELRETVSKVVLDPPRQGCEAELIDALVRRTPRRIVYISCDPATLARDAARLTEGGYELLEAQPVDMFPQTFHIETVSLWRRRERRRERRR